MPNQPKKATRQSYSKLQNAIVEEQRTYDYIDGLFKRVGEKALTYFGGGLAVLTLLYTARISPTEPFLFMPPELYGKIFYGAGVLLVVYGLWHLYQAILPRDWELPTEHDKKDTILSMTDRGYLEYILERYYICYFINIKSLSRRQRGVSKGFNPLVLGAIILLVIKIIGGNT